MATGAPSLSYKVLHVVPHLGGGVGDTLLGYLSVSPHEDDVLALGYTTECVKRRVSDPYRDHASHSLILERMEWADIVLVHQWNHPLLYNFLVREELPPCRLVMWGHNSGLHAPNMYTRKLLAYPDIFVFTTPVTMRVPVVRSSSVEKAVVWATAGVETVRPEPHEGFVVGYVGTVSYSKLHPDFLELCRGIDARFVVVGGPEKLGADGLDMMFTGRVPRYKVRDYLAGFDVFGYPLAPYHYGTCDLSLQQAMGAGIPPVVFDNPMERYMVPDGTGAVVKDGEEYTRAIQALKRDPELRRMMGDNARWEATKRFSLERLIDDWSKLFSRAMELPKMPRSWGLDSPTHSDAFLESIGLYDFEERIPDLSQKQPWQTQTKGTVHNYAFYFPEDPDLQRWSAMMRSYEDK